MIYDTDTTEKQIIDELQNIYNVLSETEQEKMLATIHGVKLGLNLSGK